MLSIAIDYHCLSFDVKQIVFDQVSINNSCNTTHASSAHGRVLLPGSIATIQKKRGDRGNALKVIDDRGQQACEKLNFSVSCIIFPETIPVSLFVISPGYDGRLIFGVYSVYLLISVVSSQASDNGNR